ncbi:uncharacterized protein A1O5_04902 [Cladophialophora psammophila CBS 110553]|uniref:Uncharacterized protein n=1 Tax=Cladophialophora psammophila CBS 110553 TaxID=1182543 RepID=W9WWV2_9EURO|nr:uncharacterized protein A1O5_04902 [Cladophialophora psammophila CBS 110553]EXJ72398.1 hypothetical protein A1O5_04902 [Cladophialophora psammophila CBS 110553]
MARRVAEELGNLDLLDEAKDEIYDVLSEIHRPNSFACCGVAEDAQDPGLYLIDHGPIRLPLSKDGAEAIISKSTQSPFGKGSETIVDTLVRKSWQLDPSQFAICNSKWDQIVSDVVDEVHSELFIECDVKNVSAQLYKMLLYEEGAFFKPHKDSEKTPGMFGTLVICLPSPHEGGELIATFNGETKSIQTALNAEFDISYAAWNADVLHEVKHVVSGYRLVLTYNLIRLRVDDDRLDMSHTPSDYKEDLVSALTKYEDGLQEPNSKFPNFLIYRLEHQYTQASLRADLLKGADLGQLQFLKQVTDDLGFGVYLASMEKEIIKSDEWEDESEISRDISLTYVVDLDGTRIDDQRSRFGVNVKEEMIIGSEPYDEEEPDAEEHSGYTGNEGCTATFWYRDTVVVIVPPIKKIDFLYQCDKRFEHVSSWIRQLRQDSETDEAVQRDLRDLCDVVVANMDKYRFGWLMESPEEKKHRTALTNEVLATALQWERLDLYDKIVKEAFTPVTPDVFRLLGQTMARAVQPESVKERVKYAICLSKTLNERHSALMSLVDGIQSTSTPEIADTAEFKAWSKQILIQFAKDAMGALKMSKADAISLADIITIWEGKDIEENVLPTLLMCGTFWKITFANSLSREIDRIGAKERDSASSKLSLEARVLISKRVYADIWETFAFEPLPKTPAPSTNAVRSIYQDPPQATLPTSPADHLLNGHDLAILLERTISLGVLTEAETKGRLRTTLTTADRDTCDHALLPFVQLVLEQQVEHMTLDRDSNEASEEDKKLVTAMLLHFILGRVGTEPSTNFHWSQPKGGCRPTCSDCSWVNDFLADPARRVGQFPMGKARRHHVHTYYTDNAGKNYTVTTLRNSNPNVLQITKKKSKAETVHDNWKQRKAEAKEMIAKLARVPCFHLYVEETMRAPILAVEAAKLVALERQPLHAANFNRPPAAGSKRAAPADSDGEEVSKMAKTDAQAARKSVRTKRGPIEVIDLT